MRAQTTPRRCRRCEFCTGMDMALLVWSISVKSLHCSCLGCCQPGHLRRNSENSGVGRGVIFCACFIVFRLYGMRGEIMDCALCDITVTMGAK